MYKEIYDYGYDYTMGNGNYTIIKTNYNNLKEPIIQEMLEWCSNNDGRKYSWSIAKLSDGITFRFWEPSLVVTFKEIFYNHIK
tara:strand:- start:9380 stop:9628 length:249 start_codon:yes stop_codon:yes gene_type:complete